MTKLTDAIDETEKARTLARAAAPQHALAEAVDAGKVHMSSILQALGFDPFDPRHQAALLICDRYGLDPLLKHVVVIQGSGAYITRDGRLHIAHRSGVFDGMALVDQGDDKSHWWAIVSVWRKDMSHPFTFRGRYPHSGSNAKHGPEMAVKVAEVAALRRAFSVDLPSLEERWEGAEVEPESGSEVVETDAREGSSWTEVELPGMPERPADEIGDEYAATGDVPDEI